MSMGNSTVAVKEHPPECDHYWNGVGQATSAGIIYHCTECGVEKCRVMQWRSTPTAKED